MGGDRCVTDVGVVGGLVCGVVSGVMEVEVGLEGKLVWVVEGGVKRGNVEWIGIVEVAWVD